MPCGCSHTAAHSPSLSPLPVILEGQGAELSPSDGDPGSGGLPIEYAVERGCHASLPDHEIRKAGSQILQGRDVPGMGMDVPFRMTTGSRPASNEARLVTGLRPAKSWRDFLGRLVVEVRDAGEIAEHAQHFPARPRFAERPCRAREALPQAFEIDVRARRLRETARWAAARARPTSASRRRYGVAATTKRAPAECLGGIRTPSAIGPGLDAAEQQIGLLRGAAACRARSCPARALGMPPGFAMRHGAREIRAGGIAAFGERAERGARGGGEAGGQRAQIRVRRMAQRQRAEPDGALLARLERGGKRAMRDVRPARRRPATRGAAARPRRRAQAE